MQVFLSHNGVCSRRDAFTLVREGNVTVNGKVVKEPSTPIDPARDKIHVEGKEVRPKTYTYLLLNKSSGYATTSSDPYAKHTIFDLIPPKYHHLSPVGRLDKDTEGLLILTNDGDINYKLTHPKHDVDKTYFVKISGMLDHQNKKKLERGIYLDHRVTAKAHIKNVKRKKTFSELYITIHEGRKRQVRRMFAKVGHKVSFLKRMSQGPIILGRLKTGHFRLLNQKEIEGLQKL